ncbi:MAG: nicotinate phosphoribosyltransferase [Deltaproteobacteria bacterium]|nr:nicotinate phosphoribosyltransferase [Deltaproteobacteria bacterium]
MISDFFESDPSLALALDQYELTMASGYLKSGLAETEAEFHMFFRTLPFGGGYVIMAGLESLISILNRFRFSPRDTAYLATLKDNMGEPLFDPPFLDYLQELVFTCDVMAVEEGTPVFPNEPLVRVRGPLIQAQLLESILLNTLNFQSLVATKAARICHAAQGDPVVEFGFRRAQGLDGALSAARAAYIGGCVGTSNTLAGKWYGIPVMGTHAHSWVMLFDTELEAFEAFSQAMPHNCVFLVDTYNTLEGVKNAIRVGLNMKARGVDMVGIRLDSGDLAYFSQAARRMLDEAGLDKAVIMASNELDEYLIRSLKLQGAAIGAWGVGTKLATCQDDPALGGVYKLTAVRKKGQDWQNKLKMSEQSVKITIPGIQQVYRYEDSNGMFIADAIVEHTEKPENVERIIDPNDPLRTKRLKDYASAEPLLKPVFQAGRQVVTTPLLAAVRQRTADQLKKLDPSHHRFENPHVYPVGISPTLHRIRDDMVNAIRASFSG